jgi:isoleucyl-tRNA synthetase
MMASAAQPDSTPTAVLSYKDSLSLPQTSFPMRAGAATREPELQAQWESSQLYQQAMARRDKSKRFVLHDGPPYLSSDKIHIGTALNKILKDIVTRYQYLQGNYTPYVPGYDGHGLPIESAVEKGIKGGRTTITPLELRQRCRDFALSNLKGQETNFKRLGVWGNWEQPYLTIDGHFEATQIRLFAQMAAKGHVYKGLKTVYWCPVSETALAEAEIEYADHESHSIYVGFELPSTQKAFGTALSDEQVKLLSGAKLLIWTTTPWTLAANVAIAANPELTYLVMQHPLTGDRIVVAQELKEAVLKAPQTEAMNVTATTWQELGTLKGSDLEGLVAKHPFIERPSYVLLGEHVTAESGTGLVHTAPGHGPDDFVIVQAYNRSKVMSQEIPVFCPVDGKGKMIDTMGMPCNWVGQFYEKVNPLVIQTLREKKALYSASQYVHSYPHSWRSHAPVIFRATEQWFINVEGFRPEALKAIEATAWIPARGEKRIASMVEGRGEWCISRQREWGVPIPAFYCQNCGALHISEEAVALVANVFEAETSDAWAQYSADDFLKEQIACSECGHRHFEKESDVMDVWFDSGVTHTAVVEARSEELGHLPVDLYLEGSDQHRGWFQSSLLTSVMLRNAAPYKAVLTHGFVLDEQGRKMSKSLGNVIDPNSVMKDYGADVLRLWVASVDYSTDVRIGQGTLKQLADIYRKIRNTARFLLGNLAGFDPHTEGQPLDSLSDLDRYVLHRLQVVTQQITEAFDQYEFYRFYQLLQNFCVVELSSLYFDVVKDILYCNAKTDPTRLGVQTVLYEVLSVLARVIIPVMPHLAEDIWSHWPEAQRPRFGQAQAPSSILLSDWPDLPSDWELPPETLHRFESLLVLRDKVNLALEDARSQDRVGSALEAQVRILPMGEEWAFLNTASMDELETLCLTSQVEVATAQEAEAFETSDRLLAQTEESGELAIYILKAEGSKCERCWKYKSSVGSHSNHTGLCTRCHEAVTTGV